MGRYRVLPRQLSWLLLLAPMGVGCAFAAAGAHAIGAPLLLLAGATLAVRATRERNAFLDLAAGAAMLVAFLALPLGYDARIALAATTLQLLALAAGTRAGGAGAWARLVLPSSGHVAIAAGSAVLLVPGGAGADVALLAYAGGFCVLLLHARWSRGSAPDPWDGLLLSSIIAGTFATTWHYVAGTGLFGWMYATRGGALLVSCASGLLALALLARPPPAPRWLARSSSSAVANALARGGALLAIFNVLFVVFSIVSLWSARLIVAALTLYIALGVTMEYRSIRRARAARAIFQEDAPALREMPDVTVLVSARNEATALPATLEKNLALPPNVRFVLVPSRSSTDGTVEVAHALAAKAPERVRVIPAAGGSKAADLNVAWASLETDVVLMLDADETIDEEGLRWGLAKLASDPAIGVVQGRKVSRTPEASALNRFVTCERRHATGLDQMLHSDLGSTHFAGSAALVRRRLVEELGGWTERTMTEDIEFTLRVHLHSDARIVYEPRMLVRESDPVDIGALVEQRTRWARGWSQCFGLYLGEVVSRRRKLGRSRAFGLAWLLTMAVSAPVMALLPAMALMRAVGIPSLLPYAIGVAIAAFILPARLVGYGYSALHDPHIPVPRRAGAMLESLFFAYAWIFVGWVLSLHALYLEVSSAPRVWYVTRKQVAARGSLPRPAAREVRA